MKTFKSFSQNLKAISPIFATLILIAIAVIAGVVVYMFTSGYLAGMAGQTTSVKDQLAVPAASTTGVVVTNMGSKDAIVTMLVLKDDSGQTVGTPVMIAVIDGTVEPEETLPISGALVPTDAGTYTVTVLTAGGGSFVSAPFTYSP